MSLTFSSVPRRTWIKLNYGAPEMIVCALLNYAECPSGQTKPDNGFLWSNIRQRAREWREAQFVTGEDLPTDIDDIIVHSRFLEDHGAPVAIRRDGEGFLISPDFFDERYGTDQCVAVLRHLVEKGGVDTAYLRRRYQSAQVDKAFDMLALLPKFAAPLGVPSVIIGVVVTLAEVEVFGPAILVVGALLTGVGMFRRSPAVNAA